MNGVGQIIRPRQGSKAQAIITVTTTTPATPPQVAKAVGTSVQHVYDVYARYGINPNTLDNFKKHRAYIFAGIQETIASKLDVANFKIDSARALKDALTGVGILFDKERLERGQATAITDYRALVVEMTGAEAAAVLRLKQLEVDTVDKD